METISNIKNELLKNISWNDFNAKSSLVLNDIINNGIDIGLNDYFNDTRLTSENREKINNRILSTYGYREISMIPLQKWKYYFISKMNVIIEKYINIIIMLDSDLNIYSDYSKHKSRDIFSEYPQEKINNTNDYATNGSDIVSEEEDYTNLIDKILLIQNEYESVFNKLINEIDCLFTRNQKIIY